MKHGSLFSGGGGFDLAAEAMGWTNVFHCEKDTFCRSVLKHYWPKADHIDDIGALDGKKYKGKIDIITGGFPCQPFSNAGQRRGVADDRYLWPEMLRVIKSISPRWVVAENVFGLINWNEGMVFDQVQSDLEAEGYQVGAYVLPAAGVNAPHQRYRVWFVGYKQQGVSKRHRKAIASSGLHKNTVEEKCSNANNNGFKLGNCKDEKYRSKTGQHACNDAVQVDRNASDTDRQRPEGRKVTYSTCKCEQGAMQQSPRLYERSGWNDWPTQPTLCSGDDGLPTELDGITFSKWRTQSIKMYGNAIVPQVALQIFKAIEEYEASLLSKG